MCMEIPESPGQDIDIGTVDLILRREEAGCGHHLGFKGAPRTSTDKDESVRIVLERYRRSTAHRLTVV